MATSSTQDLRTERLLAEVTQLTKEVKKLIELTPTRNKIWLRPSEFGQLIGVSYRQIARYREQGVFRESSFRFKGNRFEYHNVDAVADFEGREVQ